MRERDDLAHERYEDATVVAVGRGKGRWFSMAPISQLAIEVVSSVSIRGTLAFFSRGLDERCCALLERHIDTHALQVLRCRACGEYSAYRRCLKVA